MFIFGKKRCRKDAERKKTLRKAGDKTSSAITKSRRLNKQCSTRLKVHQGSTEVQQRLSLKASMLTKVRQGCLADVDYHYLGTAGRYCFQILLAQSLMQWSSMRLVVDKSLLILCNYKTFCHDSSPPESTFIALNCSSQWWLRLTPRDMAAKAILITCTQATAKILQSVGLIRASPG